MSSHPDADAFMRNYLRTPHDTTARLVFADWLEETGKPWNCAWAYYIRLRAEADRHERDSPEREELEAQAAAYGWKIRARLTIPVSLFVGYPKSLLQLLPGQNITVRLDGYEVPRPAVEFVPESVARENLMLPLDLQPAGLIVAMEDPANRDAVRRVQWMLNRTVYAVAADGREVLEGINRAFGQTAVETVDSVLVEFTAVALPRLDETPVGRLVRRIIGEAVGTGAQRVRLVQLADRTAVSYRVRGVWETRFDLPRRLFFPLRARVAELAGVASELIRSARAGGEFRFDYHGSLYTIRAAVDMIRAVIDLDVSDEFEIAG